MEGEGEEAQSPNKRAKTELEDVINPVLEKIKRGSFVEESVSDLEKEKLISDLPEKGLIEVDHAEICKELMKVRGIGQKTAKKLVKLNINSIEELAALKEDKISKTMKVSIKSFNDLIKNARKHLGREIKEELKKKLEKVKLESLEEEYSEVIMISPLKEKLDQVKMTMKEDGEFFYDELAKYLGEITKLKNDSKTLKDWVHKIDKKLNDILAEKDYKSDLDLAEIEMVESDNTPSGSISIDTLETARSNAKELNSLDQEDDNAVIIIDTSEKSSSSSVVSTDQTGSETGSVLNEQPEPKLISHNEIMERLDDVGIIRGVNEYYYRVCEILVDQNPQEIKYDALVDKSNLYPHAFSQIIFDLTTKKIIDFDVKTEIIRFWTEK
ncbi:helix-hairpin-helix domain-containing protein [Candidatus Borrarchaeum sp.]|uniref:helix-hairpin-helix domain-containing protein n=1 Tax=Candidatus Borrarchaeum sp. TaxID=2846742 RepID=UPI00257E58DE|nr:helix-hairpin-helix domain-containing protein [Candidatus Borrarchaeum sp.]